MEADESKTYFMCIICGNKQEIDDGEDGSEQRCNFCFVDYLESIREFIEAEDAETVIEYYGEDYLNFYKKKFDI